MKATMLRRVFVACTLFCLITTRAGAQTGDSLPPHRPRIGLALGGGGARGLAHVGVLEALEELHVPVDMIAGTSIGAIVGGLYAAGLSAHDIEERLATIDWDDVLSSKPARRDVEYRRKQDDPNLLIKFDMGFSGGRFHLPAGVVAAQRPSLLLRLLTLPVTGVRDFNALPVPFRAVTTDITTGDMVVLDHGDLAQSILASMAIPGVFAPVSIDGHLLVDGGVVRNLPVDVVRDMGADIVIAVDVGAPLAQAADLTSAVDVYVQTLTIFTRGNANTQVRELQPQDVLIAPDPGNTATMDFQKLRALVAAGRRSVEPLRDRLAALALPAAQYDSIAAARRRHTQPHPLDFVRVDNPSRYSTRIVKGRLTLQPGDTLDPDRLASAIDRVYGLGVFEKVDFEVAHDDTAGDGIILHLREKPWGPATLRFGLGLTDEPNGESTYELRTNMTLTGLDALGADLRTEFRAGEVRGGLVELYQPVTFSGRFFVSPWLEGEQTLFDTFQDNVRIAEYDTDRLSAGFDAGVQFGRWGQLRMGVERRKVHADPLIGEPTLPTYDVRHTVFGAQLDIDRLDDVYFPTRGGLTHLRFERASHSDSVPAFTRLQASALSVFSAGPHTLITALDAGTGFGPDLPAYEQFELGGFLHLSGLHRRQAAGRYFALGRLIYMNRVGDAVGLRFAGGLRMGGSLELGNAWQDPPPLAGNALRLGVSIFGGLETVLGPLYAAYGIADRGRRAWYILLGRAL